MDMTRDVSRHRQAVPIGQGVHWIGALDPGLRTFDIILHTDYGTTYNSYLVRGRDGVAVIDTVKAECADEFFARLESIADYDEIRAIVLNHLEPDHSGALPELIQRAPQAPLYLSPRGVGLIKGLFKVGAEEALPLKPVRTGDSLSLGDRTLRFLSTPFLHWPDTQCTYLVGESVLFTGDLFGCHLCDGRLFDDLLGDFSDQVDHYFAHIMRPFKQHVGPALDLIDPLPVRVIAPAHGPVLRDRPRRYLDRYRVLAAIDGGVGASPDAPRSLAIFFVSAYGNTARMAEAIGEGAARQPGVRVRIHDLSGAEAISFLAEIEAADAILLGSPTINADAVKPIWDLLASLAVIDVRGKVGGAFGSYGWSGEAVRLIEERLRGLKLRVPVAGLRIKLIPDEEELNACRELGAKVAGLLTGASETEPVVEMADLG